MKKLSQRILFMLFENMFVFLSYISTRYVIHICMKENLLHYRNCV